MAEQTDSADTVGAASAGGRLTRRAERGRAARGTRR